MSSLYPAGRTFSYLQPQDGWMLEYQAEESYPGVGLSAALLGSLSGHGAS